ncbi:MAG: hypothetical protein K0Q74_1277 [Gammaproteobacteria bacterium]|jgi:hypothetical protein|nr:hypothetical protein [Gammaproteobacteria bacterium]
MIVMLFFMISVAMGLVLWTDKYLLSMVVFWVTLVLVAIVFFHHMTDKLNIAL